jgi:alkyl sulfatase BDS1-like metallo-beta-lactamase superfamily hydrolase
VEQSLDQLIRQGEGDQDAVAMGDGIFTSRGIANTYLVTCDDGDLLVNTGLAFEAPAIKERFARVSANPLRTIVLTQGHPDHVGGWSQFDGPGVETIAQANHADVREYWHRLHPFYTRRIMKLWARFTGHIDAYDQPPEPVITTTFVDRHAFALGTRRFELLATPGGEATDALVVWLPDERIAFIGNLLGPMFGHLPNLYTVRGDKVRSAIACLHGIDRVLDLGPRVLVNGHDVLRGPDEIRTTLTAVRDALAHLRDRTIGGMNDGLDLWTLMRQVTLPPDLALPQMHGKVPWVVRAIWEEHAGWFRYESTTELYDIPPSAVWDDLLDLAGGPGAVTRRARAHVTEGRPLHALHLTDIVLSREPGDAAARAARRAALEQLLVASGRENFSEVQWLESELADLAEATPAAPDQGPDRPDTQEGA